MRRIVVGVVALLLVGGLAMAWTSPACGCTLLGPVETSNLVGVAPGWSVGLVTVTAGGGEVRTSPMNGEVETSVTVAPVSWVGSVPSTLWVAFEVDHHPIKRLLGIGSSSYRPSLEAFRPGTQWVVRVRNADAHAIDPLPVVGNTVRIPMKRVVDDVDGADPKKVSLDALRDRARRTTVMGY
jgi:hypothetical protein